MFDVFPLAYFQMSFHCPSILCAHSDNIFIGDEKILKNLRSAAYSTEYCVMNSTMILVLLACDVSFAVKALGAAVEGKSMSTTPNLIQ